MALMRMNFVLFGGLKHVLRDLIKISDTVLVCLHCLACYLFLVIFLYWIPSLPLILLCIIKV